MRIFVALLFLCSVARGQFLSPGIDWSAVPVVPQPVLDPTNMLGVGWVWRASDTGTNVSVLTWIDEMKSFYATNSSGSAPTNHENGVRFSDNKFLYVTNGLRIFDPTNSWFMVFTEDNVGLQKILFETTGTKFISINGSEHWVSIDSDFTDNPITVGSVQDICWGGGPVGTAKTYTNGVQAKPSNTLFSTTEEVSSFGNFSVGFDVSKHWMQWLVVFTNTMDSTTLSNLHYLRTNKWGGTP